VGLERGPPSFVSTTEEILERKSSGSCLEIREYGRRDPSRLSHGTLYPQMLALTSPTIGRSIGIVRSRTQATEFGFFSLSGKIGTEKYMCRLHLAMLMAEEVASQHAVDIFGTDVTT
jgi:hypothetical protein